MRSWIQVIKDSLALSLLTTALMVFAAFVIFLDGTMSSFALDASLALMLVGLAGLVAGVTVQRTKAQDTSAEAETSSR